MLWCFRPGSIKVEYSMSFRRLYDSQFLRSQVTLAFQNALSVRYVMAQWQTYLRDYHIDDDWVIQGKLVVKYMYTYLVM